MAGRELAEAKNAEVREIASKYGVERYLNTEKLAIVDALVKTWADGAEDDDPLSRSTKWLETKSEIEDIIALTALENNSKETMYLLGTTATGQISFEEVRAAYADGYNTLMRQYSNTIGTLNQKQLTDIERMRDRFAVTMPMFGSLEEKHILAQQAKEALNQLEAHLANLNSKNIVASARVLLGEKETTRTLILSTAEAGFRDGSLTQTDYQQIQNLIGRQKSLFQGQMKALNQYGNNTDALFAEMDRALQRANDVLAKQESRYALMGSFVTTPELQQVRQVRARLGTTGDGIRAVRPSNKILQATPQIVGESVTNGNGTYPAWVGLPNQLQPPSEPTVIANPKAAHIKFMNPADVYRNEPMQSRFSAYHEQKNKPLKDPQSVPPQLRGVSPAVAAKNGTGLGSTAVEKAMPAWAFTAIAVGGLFAAPGIIKAFRSTRTKGSGGSVGGKAPTKDEQLLGEIKKTLDLF